MRCFLLLLLFLIPACVQPDPAFGTRTVATSGCRDPQTSYVRNVANLNGLGLWRWEVLTDISQHLDYEVLCEDFTSDCLDSHIASACGSQAGYFDLMTSNIHVDNARANGEFAWTFVLMHESIHAVINLGPHPERARLHICPCGMVNVECWTGGCGGENIMSPTGTGLGTSTGTSWTGSVETIDVGDIALVDVTLLDAQFVRWAISP